MWVEAEGNRTRERRCYLMALYGGMVHETRNVGSLYKIEKARKQLPQGNPALCTHCRLWSSITVGQNCAVLFVVICYSSDKKLIQMKPGDPA